VKLLAVPVVVGVAALALGGTSRFLAHRRASPWVVAAQGRSEHRRDAWVAPPLEPLREVGALGRERLFVWGRFRIAWGEAIRVEAEPTSRVLYDATRVRDGWIFVTATGGVLRSDDFFAPLRPITLPFGHCAHSGTIQPSFGRAVVLAPGAIFTSDGGAFTHLDGSLRLRAAAFGDASWGLGIVRGGRLVETRDGGASWRQVPSVAAMASALEGFEGGVRYFTDTWHVLRPDGGTSAAPLRGALFFDDLERIQEAIRGSSGVVLGAETPAFCSNPFAWTRNPLELRVTVDAGATRLRPMSGGRRSGRQALDASIIDVVSLASRHDAYRVRWRTRGQTVQEALVRGVPMPHAWAATAQGLLVRNWYGDRGPHDYWLAAQVTEFRDALWEEFRHALWEDPSDELCEDPPCRRRSVVATNDGLLAWATDDGSPERSQPIAVAPDWDLDPHVAQPEPILEPPRHRLERLSFLRCTRAGCSREDWFDDTNQDVVVGALRDGDRWGVLAVERECTDGRLPLRRRFVATRGFERSVEALGRVMDLSPGAPLVLTPCGETIGPWEIHTFSRSWREPDTGHMARRGHGFPPTVRDDIQHAVFEFNAERICLRRLDAHPGESTAVSAMPDRPRPPDETSWLEARDGQLVGGRDDGNTITELRGQITRE
jgi:hypothetical protein